MVTLTSTSYPVINGLNLHCVDDFGVEWFTENVDGWEGSPQGSLDLNPKPRQAGSWAGDSFPQSRPVQISGRISAPTTGLLRDAVNRLNAAVTYSAGTLLVTEGDLSRWATVRRSDQVTVDSRDLWAAWSLQVVAPDPRKFAAAPLTASTFLPATSGGVTFPLTFPFTFSETVTSGIITLTNPGNAVGAVVLRIDGPATGPQVAHRGQTGGAITFATSYTMGTGEWLTIDADRRTILANDQSPRRQFVTSAGWFGFDPGINTFSLSSAAYNAATKLTVTAYPAWL